MKTYGNKLIAVFACVIVLINKSNAQVEQISNYIYAMDSVAGFDEQSASAAAIANACYGREYKVFLYRAKRDYVKQKYNLKRSALPLTSFQNTSAHRAPVVLSGSCDNEDFELAATTIVAPGAVQGWSLQSGTSNNSCNPPVLNAVNFYTVYNGPIVDARLPGQISSYFDSGQNATPSGNCFIRLNDDNAGGKAVRLSKSFIPDAGSALFQYAYIAVIEDGAHSCCDQAGFNIKITVTNTVTNTSTLLACPNISVAVPGAGCAFTIPPGGPVFNPCIGAAGWSYANWTASAIDLTQYLNNLVRIDVTVVDCALGGHGGYFYFDAKCSAMSILGNNSSFPAGTPSITLPTCGAQGATICATPGLGPYSWAGPGVNPPFDTPSLSNQCFTATLSATYTLYMNPPGSCAPIARIITTTITPAPMLLGSVVQAICGNSLAMITVTPAGSAAIPSALSWSPAPFSINSGTTVASYTLPPGPAPQIVTITATDPLGCLVTETVNVNPVAPVPTLTLMNITGSPSITCANPYIVLNAASNYTYGTLNYFWSSNSATYATNPATIVTSGSVVATIFDPVTHCADTKTIYIGSNTTPPQSNVVPLTQNITCNLNSVTTVTATANPSVNVSHHILFFYGGSLTPSGAHSLICTPPVGTHTHVVVNMINGCTTSQTFAVTSSQGFPTFSVQSPSNFTLGCTTKSCAVVNIVGASTTSGSAVSYTILGPGGSGVTPPGALSVINTYTVCTPGTWTVITKDNNSFCETRVPISILQNTFPPNLSVVATRQILDCYVPKVTLKANSLSNGVSYVWGLPVFPGNQAGDTLTVYANTSAANNTLLANYSVTVTDSSSSCKSFSVVTMLQNLFPPIAAVSDGGVSAITCITPSMMLTNNSSSTIPPIFPPGYVVASQWEGPTPQEPKFNQSTYVAVTVGVYTMTATDLTNGCKATATVNIGDKRNYPMVNIPIQPSPSVLDCGSKFTKLTPIITTPTSGLTYTWIPPANAHIDNQFSMTLTTDAIGEYKVIVLNPQNGCKSTGFMEVIKGKLTADFEPDMVSGYAPLTVNFENRSYSTLSNAGVNSAWNFGNGNSVTNSTVTTISNVYTQSGTYTVTLFASKGTCIETKQKIIRVEIPSQVSVPNVFTPNGDGVNDLFFLKLTNLSHITIQIIDRWGHKIYEVSTNRENAAWDGRNQFGKEAAEGAYFYIVKAQGDDGAQYDLSGTVSLFR